LQAETAIIYLPFQTSNLAMSWFLDAIACGVISGLTWAGLVWMSPSTPIEQPLGWWQGIGAIVIANISIWLGLAFFKPQLGIWVIIFLAGNALVGKFVLPFCQQVRIPPIWAVVVHPVAIATINMLLGGALGAIS
jgi:hypothetical protein